ncbi:tripartite tricarboxylate transporter substrate binding protein [Bradyrhizobium japonicum]|uniref:tripartite tricarboxylate transporter substrate binding protein n=1 Tax=Bradyrhizobium japonicum TaxID=375 RepID=UPI001BABFF51|nr:tripartite tricarboxylate transporter substrate binding protein [Bradyrhizobium japonicum]MBR0910348.1 tripartite tricarboxylate transporter substrate binding protein [Bradyrhizobium japonicum]
MLRRRKFVQFAALAIAASANHVFALRGYPNRPVYLIVGFSPGGNTDIVARTVGRWLSQQFRQSFIVENHIGAATNLATEKVVRAAPDGCTLLVASAANAINAALYRNLKFNFIRDTVPIAMIVSTPLVMCVNPALPVRSVSEFVARATAEPGRLNFASSGLGSPPHVAAELFKMMTAVDMMHIAYRGDAEAIADLIGGRVHLYFATLPGAMGFIRSGALRALAIGAAERSPSLPDVPAMTEFLPGYEATIWNGLNAPKNTPDDIVLQINRAVNAGLGDPILMAPLAELGARALPGSPDDYARFLAAETVKWGRIVDSIGARLE